MEVAFEELEFAVREYATVTDHLIEVMDKADDEEIPASITGSLLLLADAINREWG